MQREKNQGHPAELRHPADAHHHRAPAHSAHSLSHRRETHKSEAQQATVEGTCLSLSPPSLPSASPSPVKLPTSTLKYLFSSVSVSGFCLLSCRCGNQTVFEKGSPNVRRRRRDESESGTFPFFFFFFFFISEPGNPGMPKMPGTSRMPVSLRESFNSVKRSRPTNPLQVLSLDLLVNFSIPFSAPATQPPLPN